MKIQILFLSLLFSLALVFNACNGGDSSSSSERTGTLSLNIADAPLVDDANVTGVFITVSRVEYHVSGDTWQTMEDFNTSINPINLLDWQDGKSFSLGNFQLPAGKYTQIRFILDAVEEGTGVHTDTGCFIQFNSNTNETLYVPSGTKTGYKAIGTFTVPVNGDVNITADFDVRKSIIYAGGKYKLKPTIKLVVTNESGSIEGNVTNIDSNATLYAYEYANDVSTWEGSSDELEDSNGLRFSNAVTSAALKVADDGNFTLSFLTPGKYDLVTAQFTDTDVTILDVESGVEVTSGQTTTVSLTLDNP